MTSRRGLFIAITAALAAVAVLAVPASSEPVGTAFTYQGKLTDSTGNPISGTRDMTFKLFDSPNPFAYGGHQVGPTVTKTGVNVSGGLFTVQLDFGPVFEGGKRWLWTTVGGEMMWPFVELTPVPNAIVAGSAHETRGYENALVGVSTITKIVQDSYGNDLMMVPKKIITLALAYGQTTKLRLTPQALPETVGVEISKTMRQLTVPADPGRPETQVPLADSPVVTIKLSKTGCATQTITLSLDDPVYNTEFDPNCTPTTCPLSLQARLASDSQLCLEVDESNVSMITTETTGIVKSVEFGVLIQGARGLDMFVTVDNYGDLASDYVVTVTELGPYFEPVPPFSVTLDSCTEVTHKFGIRSSKALTSANTCRVSVKSTYGKLLDSRIVHFPEPTAP